jgi:hypothetical protein
VTVKLVDFVLQLLVAIVLLSVLHRGLDVHFSLHKIFVVLPGAVLLTIVLFTSSMLGEVVLSEVDLTLVSPFYTKAPVPERMFYGREREIKDVLK